MFAVPLQPASCQILWTFSIYLEAVAIMPQLYMVSKTGEAETITSHYLFCLGLYRCLYIFNWVWRYYTESFYDLIAIVAGCVQTILYCDFFYLYITKGNLPLVHMHEGTTLSSPQFSRASSSSCQLSRNGYGTCGTFLRFGFILRQGCHAP